jgi:carbamoyl-phosphate synthase large subunit
MVTNGKAAVKTNGKALTLLVTGAGAPGIRGTLYALRHNPDGRAVRIVGVDTQARVAGAMQADKFYTVPAPETTEYIPALIEICRRENVSAILPQTTRETAKLAASLPEVERAGVEVMVSESSAISAANDKGTVIEVFERLGLPAPACRRATTERELLAAAEELGYPETPVVVKPPVSNGMRGVRVLRPNAWDVQRFLTEKPHGLEITLEELVAILRRGPWPELLVMEYLPGCEYSVDAFIGAHFSVAVPRVRESIRSGITFHSRTELREDLMEYTLAAGLELGLRFAFGFQFKLACDGTPKVLECNPRIQGTMVASVFSGANVIWFGVRELFHDPVTNLPQPLRASEFMRYWGGIGVKAGDLFEI